MKKAMILTAALAVILSGCASTKFEDKYDSKEGWRRGNIDQIGKNIVTDRYLTVDCRQNKLADAQGQFAQVRFYHNKFWRTGVFPLDHGAVYKPGDDVYVNMLDCRLPMVKQQTER